MTPTDVKIVADNIYDFIEVPNSVSRLRNAVLTLAISGNFTPAGCSSWTSLKLGDFCSVKKGKKPELYDTEDKEMLPYLEAKFIRGSKPAKFAKISDKNSIIVAEDDLIIICDGSNSGEFFTGVNGILASTMGVLTYDKEVLLKEYLEIFLQSNFDFLNKTKKGAAIPHLDFNLFNSLELNIPQLEEQGRIVEKVESVMKQLDELESRKSERDYTRTRLSQSAMQALSKGDSEVAFEHMSELVKVSDDVKNLESSLITLAVSGSLSDPTICDSSAIDLLKALDYERNESVANNKFKAKVLKDEELPPLPDGWVWTTLSSLFSIVTDGDHQPPTRADSGVPFLVIGNLNNRVIDFKNCRYVSDDYFNALDPIRKPRKRDILYTVTGSWGIPIPVNVDAPFCVQRHVAILKALPSTPVEYVNVYLQSSLALKYGESIATGIAQKTIPLRGLREMPIPLPPEVEQKRIVKKIEELMLMVNELKKLIT